MEIQRTPTHQLADLLLGEAGPLDHWVRARRAEGLSWRKVERALHKATDGRIDVTFETLRQWVPDTAEAAS